MGFIYIDKESIAEVRGRTRKFANMWAINNKVNTEWLNEMKTIENYFTSGITRRCSWA